MQKKYALNQVEIWSQPNCQACDSGKQLMDSLGIEYNEYNLAQGYREQFFQKFPGCRSVPQFRVDNQWIGGLQEFKMFINDYSKTLKMV